MLTTPLHINRVKVCHSELFTLQPFCHFGTIKHVSAQYTLYPTSTHRSKYDFSTSFKKNEHFSVNLLYQVKRVLLGYCDVGKYLSVPLCTRMKDKI